MRTPDLLRFIIKRKTVLVSFCVLSAIVLAAILAPFLVPHNPQRMKLSERLLAPNLSHWFGTDMFGRDLFSRVISGGRTSLLIGMSASILALFVGGGIGVIAGYFHWTTMVLMRLVECRVCTGNCVRREARKSCLLINVSDTRSPVR